MSHVQLSENSKYKTEKINTQIEVLAQSDSENSRLTHF
jgi:hypothetical protein